MSSVGELGGEAVGGGHYGQAVVVGQVGVGEAVGRAVDVECGHREAVFAQNGGGHRVGAFANSS